MSLFCRRLIISVWPVHEATIVDAVLEGESMAKFMIDDFTQHFNVQGIWLAALIFLSTKGFAKNLLIWNYTSAVSDRPESKHP